MPVIVLEGPDGAGKTTLSEQIRAEAGKRYFLMMRHSCRPLSFADAMRFYDLVNAANQNLDLLIDRHPLISEPIYGPLLRGHNLVNRFSQNEIIGMLERSVTHIVYCRPPLAVMEKGIRSQPQLAGVAEKLFQLVNSYDRFFKELPNRSRIRVIEYDWTITNPTNLIKELFP